MLPSVGVASAKDDVDGGMSEIDVSRARLTTQRTETAHRTFSPLKHFTETRKTRRTHTVLPCVTNIVVYGNDVRVRGRNGRRKKHAARTHARTHADSADDCCTQNIVPSEKWQLGHCAA